MASRSRDVLLPIIIPGGFLLWVIFEMLGKMWEGYVATEGAEVPGEVIWPEVQRAGFISEDWKIDDILALVRKRQDARDGGGV